MRALSATALYVKKIKHVQFYVLFLVHSYYNNNNVQYNVRLCVPMLVRHPRVTTFSSSDRCTIIFDHFLFRPLACPTKMALTIIIIHRICFRKSCFNPRVGGGTAICNTILYSSTKYFTRPSIILIFFLPICYRTGNHFHYLFFLSRYCK